MASEQAKHLTRGHSLHSESGFADSWCKDALEIQPFKVLCRSRLFVFVFRWWHLNSIRKVVVHNPPVGGEECGLAVFFAIFKGCLESVSIFPRVGTEPVLIISQERASKLTSTFEQKKTTAMLLPLFEIPPVLVSVWKNNLPSSLLEPCHPIALKHAPISIFDTPVPREGDHVSTGRFVANDANILGLRFFLLLDLFLRGWA
mmetsp:Transcript_82164/g.164204  ORF Transcript_82164/g.164204 Transcript_82164/m.164204 type:complete len:202 (-) Transcript_82164:1885-2490(-)